MEQHHLFAQTAPEPHLYNNFFDNLKNADTYLLNLMPPFIFAANYKGDPGMVDDPQFTLEVYQNGTKIQTLYSEIISEESNAAMVLSLITHNLAWFNTHNIVPALAPGSGEEDATLLLAADPKICSFVAGVPNHDPLTAPDNDAIEYYPSVKRLENSFTTFIHATYLMDVMETMFKIIDKRLHKKGKIFYISNALFEMIKTVFPESIQYHKAFEGFLIPVLFEVPVKVKLSWDLWAARLGVSPYMALLTIPQNIIEDEQDFVTDVYSYNTQSNTLKLETQLPLKTFNLKDPTAAIFAY